MEPASHEMFSEIADNTNFAFVCSDRPCNYIQASRLFSLGGISIKRGLGNGVFSVRSDLHGDHLLVKEIHIRIYRGGHALWVALVDASGAGRVLVCTKIESPLHSLYDFLGVPVHVGDMTTVPQWELSLSSPEGGERK